ncbi:hypothetical protein COO91_05264 [Nostoc flagelliforme CCNUN1]|uniref:Uncharacterized protein n=1 Tax=Nostoc flagelliforme CCNUN1 TaxID=2038116 RepID=A0A2K8SV03_9NOSO|nr:hypothetical protein COO91_05264 [Nostoc flagelliforme CCNUN1]
MSGVRRNNVSRVQLPVISTFGMHRVYKRLKLQMASGSQSKK